jgi:deoxyribodipyrimidine photolyase-related protein
MAKIQSPFITQLQALSVKQHSARSARRWTFAAYDQLTDAYGPLARGKPETLGLILIEAPAKAARRPYHKQKLALVLTNMRHFALEQAARGVLVKYVIAKPGNAYAETLSELARELGAITMMTPAEWELREELKPLVSAGVLTMVPHEGWLTSRDDFAKSQSKPPWRMDAFYKHVRKSSGILMEDGKPEGGKFSFDADNRQKWTGTPKAPEALRFTVDDITREVCTLVETQFANHPGTLRPEALPASKADAEAVWAFAKKKCLPQFGPFEDAMSTQSRRLFHASVSSLLNMSRLTASRLVGEVATMNVPLSSREGFIRQILGWREFVRHVHVETEGFRTLPQVTAAASDGGYARWSGKAWPSPKTAKSAPASAQISHLGASNGVPPAFWGAKSGLFCLDHVVETVWDEAYSHHITRLMVLSNIATLLDLAPRELTDWFWVAYDDAYDWVVEPNVLGMGTFAAGDLMTTKPYISGAAYIHKMSDYCGNCAFDPKKNCPITRLYWAFLARHQDALAGNHRLAVPLGASRKRAESERAKDRETYETVRDTLAKGKRLTVL